MNRRQLLQASAFAAPAFALPIRNLFGERPIVPPPPTPRRSPVSVAVFNSYQSNTNLVLPRLSTMGVSQAQVSSLATAHNTWTNELADTQNTATINNSIAANPSSVIGFNPSTYTIPSSVMQVVLAWCPLFTEELLMQQVQGFTSANAQTLITGGIGPQLQSMLQGLEALITQAESGDVLLRRYGRDSRGRFQTAEYRPGSGGAHFELAKFGAMWGLRVAS